jgi:polynucleotide 5'-kinase involved in rRNA processing
LDTPIAVQVFPSANQIQVTVVGRQEELEQLRTHLEIASSSQRQTIFVTGDQGIGKATLVETFTNALSASGQIVISTAGASSDTAPVRPICRSGRIFG